MKAFQIGFLLVCVFIQDIDITHSIRIGTFDITEFKQWKLEDPVLSSGLAAMICHYDVTFLQGAESETLVEMFVTKMNSFCPLISTEKNYTYEYVVDKNASPCERTEPCNMQEVYAFIYRSENVKVNNVYSHNSSEYECLPLVGKLEIAPIYDMDSDSTNDTSNMTLIEPGYDFIIIGHHSSKKQALNEVKGLDNAFCGAKDTYDLTDGYILGNFEADCDYLKIEDLLYSIIYKPTYFCWLTDKYTSVIQKECSFDRILAAGYQATSCVLADSAVAFNVQDYFDNVISRIDRRYQITDISEHTPLSVEVDCGDGLRNRSPPITKCFNWKDF